MTTDPTNQQADQPPSQPTAQPTPPPASPNADQQYASSAFGLAGGGVGWAVGWLGGWSACWLVGSVVMGSPRGGRSLVVLSGQRSGLGCGHGCGLLDRGSGPARAGSSAPRVARRPSRSA